MTENTIALAAQPLEKWAKHSVYLVISKDTFELAGYRSSLVDHERIGSVVRFQPSPTAAS